MRVLAVLGICLLIAFNEAAARAERERYCCGKSPQDVPTSVENGTCVSFKEYIHNNLKKHLIDPHHAMFMRSTEASNLQAWMKTFGDAALDCISNNRIFRNVHAAMDELHSIVEGFTPEHIEKKIAEAQDYMDEQFANLSKSPGGHPSGVLEGIEDFISEHTKKALKVFHDVRNAAESAFSRMEAGPLSGTFDVLVESVHDCLGTHPMHHEEMFGCRRKVRSVAYDFLDRIKMRLAGGKTKLPPHHMIDRMLLPFTAGVNVLESMISDEFTERKIFGTHRIE